MFSYFIIKLYECTHLNHLFETILMSTLTIQYCEKKKKKKKQTKKNKQKNNP